MVGLLFRTPETVATETPASRAMSRMVYKRPSSSVDFNQNIPTTGVANARSYQTKELLKRQCSDICPTEFEHERSASASKPPD
jgi:hypothetical protein